MFSLYHAGTQWHFFFWIKNKLEEVFCLPSFEIGKCSDSFSGVVSTKLEKIMSILNLWEMRALTDYEALI
jgi:hypothetical protein